MSARGDLWKPTVLVVEDEPAVRLVLVEALRDAGYAVMEAWDGDVASRLLEQNANSVRAAIADIYLPGSMNGVALAERIWTNWPWINVVLTSGRPLPTHLKLPENIPFLRKPFALPDVLRRFPPTYPLSGRS